MANSNSNQHLSPLIDALGGYLTGVHQSEVAALSADVQEQESARKRAEVGRQVYQEMYQTAEEALTATQTEFEFAIQARDRVIMLLMNTAYRYAAMCNNNYESRRTDEQLAACAHYTDELIEFTNQRGWNTWLLSADEVQDRVHQELLREELMDMSTDEDSDSGDEIIDLTEDDYPMPDEEVGMHDEDVEMHEL